HEELVAIPPDCELTALHAEIPAWDDMDVALKPVLAREMENYAGYLAFTDHHVGRLIAALAGLEILDDTLVYYIIGDNGASAEGTVTGTFNSTIGINGDDDLETPQYMNERRDTGGSPGSAPQYAVGWAYASE